MKLNKLIFVILISLSGYIYCQTNNHFEFTLKTPYFTNGMGNLAIYIEFPSVSIWGWMEVTITSSYNYQRTTGKLTKRYEIGHNPGSYFHQRTEIPAAFGDVADQWHIGDFDHDNNRIPIYHLVSTQNYLVIQIEGVITSTSSIESIINNTNLSSIEQIPFSGGRHYMSIMQDRVGIGTTETGTHKLAVEGSIGAREIKVEASGWSDFVFTENYPLLPITELEQYINQNKHLPEIPTAEQVAKEGISLGEMNAKLLQKIEELTLYVIELKKENEVQQQEIEKLITK